MDKHWFHYIPRIDVSIWDEHGHFLFIDDPERFNAEVEVFLKKHKLVEELLASKD